MRALRVLQFSLALSASAGAMLAILAEAQLLERHREPSWYAAMVESRASTARQYTFDATIEVGRKIGEGPREAIETFKTKLAVAPERRYLFWLGDQEKLHYLIASDGRQTWVFDPAMNRYLELDAVVSMIDANPETAFAEGPSKEGLDAVACSNLVVPILSKLAAGSAAVVDMKWPAPPYPGDSVRELPLLTVLLAPPNSAGQRLTELSLDPDTLEIAHLSWNKSGIVNDEPRFTFLSAAFTKFELGKEIPAGYFVFGAGNARRVEDLPVPGGSGDGLEGKRMPDLQVQLSDGRKVKISELHGSPIVIAFSDSECVPCLKQADALVALAPDFKDRRIVVISAGKKDVTLHSLFRVRFVPSLAIIDKDGAIVRFLAGGRSAEALRSVLTAAGI